MVSYPNVHAQAVLSVVLEQGVAPCGAASSLLVVYGLRGGTAPDGGAAGGVGDVHLLAEQLGDQAGVRSLGAACAGAGELKQRLVELRTLTEIGTTTRICCPSRCSRRSNRKQPAVQLGSPAASSRSPWSGRRWHIRRSPCSPAEETADGELVLASLGLGVSQLGAFGSISSFVAVRQNGRMVA